MSDAPLTPTRVERIQQLFDAAVALPPTQRERFLLGITADDAVLRADVLALLEAHESADDRLVSPFSSGARAAAAWDEEGWDGVRLGSWRVERRIGAGGMGTVHEAVRDDDEFHRKVAVKLLHRGRGGEVAVRRFRTERQILARLNHPNIATLLDAGTSTEGQPYIVMEFVDGVPITEWCDARQLGVRERVELFLQVCAAVQHAHQNLVVHRDLKPGNILVTSDGVVKLLDFGVAKLMPEGDDVPEVTATQVAYRAFTPEYAAPEQFQESAVGTSADVYALGVVLFELLAGRRPIEVAGRSFREMEAAVCTLTPPRPSTVMGEERWRALAERNSARARVRVAGDLDAIVTMALRKEPERRYGSVEQLGRDVAHYLEGLPVSARSDGFGYRARKFIRRRRVETAAVVIAFLSLGGGLVAAVSQAQRAEAQSYRAAEVISFLNDMLSAADPAAYGRDVTVRAMLDSAAVRAHTLSDRPDIETEIRYVVGNTYLALGEYDAAEEQFKLELDAYRRLSPRGSRDLAVGLTRLAKVYEFQGRYEAADSVFGEAWKLYAKYPPSTPIDQAIVLDNHGRILAQLGRDADARRSFQQSLALGLRYDAANDSSLAVSYNNLAVISSRLGDYTAADTLMALAHAAAVRRHGEDHVLIAAIASAHASVLSASGDTARADSAYVHAIDMRLRLIGEDHPDIATTMYNYADHLLRTGRPVEGAHWARKVLAMRGRSLPETHLGIGAAMQVLGRSLVRLDSLAAGEHWVREGLAHRRANLPADHWLIHAGEGGLGEALTAAGRYAEAERILLASERRLTELRGEGTLPVQDARKRLVGLYEAWNRPDDAARWRVMVR
ncbi:serine/threonine-protein kinase [soil metagenome]